MNISNVYSPFNCPLSKVTLTELEGLKDIEEGWFIEYKSEVIERKKIAKSLAAFANQHGGWLIFGVEEKKGDNSASSFPGFVKQELEKLKESIRDASRQFLKPSVYYESHEVQVAQHETHTSVSRDDETKYVLILRIPESANTPHIHKDGKIYQRVGDSSNPQHVTEPATFQALWGRNQSALADFNKLALSAGETSKSEENNSYLHLTLSADPLEISGNRFSGGFTDFARIMSSGSLQFDNIFATNDGYVARQHKNNLGGMLTLTWTFYVQGHSKVTIPINQIKHSHLSYFGFFKRKHSENQLDGYGILDANNLLMVILECVVKHRALASQMHVNGPFYIKGLAENIWRTTPFLNYGEYKEYVEEYGLPLNQYTDVSFPKGIGFQSLYINKFEWNNNQVCLNINSLDDKAFAECISNTAIIAMEAFSALGIPMGRFFSEQHKLSDFLSHFLTRDWKKTTSE